MRTTALALALTTAVTANVFAAEPADGVIDTSFGVFNTGRNLIAFDESAANPIDIARAAVADASGRTYVVGTVVTDAGNQIGITRLLRNGLVDTNYGSNGKVVAPAGAIVTGVAAVLDAQGALIVGGTRSVSGSNTDFALCRFNTAGQLAAFPGHPQNLACVSYSFNVGAGNNTDTLRALTIDNDGRFVVVGDAGVDATNTHAAVLRLLSNGTPDPNFTADGRINFLTTGQQRHGLYAVDIEPNGKIVVAGESVGNSETMRRGLIARVLDNGFLDPQFSNGSDGSAGIGLYTQTSGFGRFDVYFRAVEVDSVGAVVIDSGIFAAGAVETAVASGRYNGLALYATPSGTVVGSFGSAGYAAVDGGFNLTYEAMTRDPQRRLILVGTRTATNGATSDFRVTRMTRQGDVDALTFNFPFGHATIDVTQNNRQDTAFAVSVQSGRIVVAGSSLTSTPPPNLDFGVAAVLLDSIFAADNEIPD